MDYLGLSEKTIQVASRIVITMILNFILTKKRLLKEAYLKLVDRSAIPGNPCFIEIDHFTHIYKTAKI